MIREASRSESPLISQLISEVAREHVVPSLSAAGGNHLLAGMDEERIRSFFDAGWPFFVAEESDSEGDRRLIGVSAVRPPAHLHFLFVRTCAQRRGIGRRLWQQARAWIEGESDAEVITVNSSLNAVAAYETFGFEPAGPVSELNGVRFQPMERRKKWEG